jgi:hypothetical protein
MDFVLPFLLSGLTILFVVAATLLVRWAVQGLARPNPNGIAPTVYPRDEAARQAAAQDAIRPYRQWHPPSFPSMVLLAAVVGTAGLAGCAQLSAIFHPPPTDYVGADAVTYSAVAPYHATYVAADPTMTPDQKARRLRTLESWRLRIEQNGGIVPTTQPSIP